MNVAMRRGFPLLLVPPVVLLMLAPACGGGQSESQPPTSAPGGKSVDPATAGNISGRVIFSGTVPTADPIDMSMDARCASQAGSDVRDRALVVVDGGLDNAFVYVKSGLSGYAFRAPADPARLDQDGCVYLPRVLGVQVGQPLEITNSDPLLHNVHAAATANRQFNTAQPFEGMRSTHTFSQREIMVPFKCDVHPWMIAYVGVVDHPYFAVTNAGGQFELKDLPAGTYTVEAWHEKLGTQTADVTIAPKETRTVELAFTGS
jgi:plastocyanin